MRGMILGVVAAAGVSGAVVGFLQAGSARSAEAAARGRAAGLEGDVAGLRKELEAARAETTAAVVEVTGLRKDLAKAKADLDLAKQSMIELQAAAREADAERFAASEKARAAAEARARAEASAAAKAREADAARAGLEDARARAAAAEAAGEERSTAAKTPSGKAIAACAAIAEVLNLSTKTDLTDPEKVASAHLEWLTGEGGWSARDVTDLGGWIREFWRSYDVVTDPKRKARRGEVDPIADEFEKTRTAILQVRKEFLDGKPAGALKTFRFWRPARD